MIGWRTLNTPQESESLMPPAEPAVSLEKSRPKTALVMTLPLALATVAGCTLVTGLVGGAVGLALGTQAPAYYRSVFRHGNEPWFDPPSVGLGLGLSQGLILGALVGLSLVALFLWRDSQAK